jgi:invasion protein IalB
MVLWACRTVVFVRARTTIARAKERPMGLGVLLAPSCRRRLAALAMAATITPALALAQSTAPTAPITYSGWAKVCGRDSETKTVCLTAHEARGANGAFVGAALIDMQDRPRKVLRITLPPGVDRDPRVVIDKDQPIVGRPVGCVAKGCVADFDVGAEVMTRLKGGKTLTMSGANASARTVTYALPLAGFAKAYEEPPARPRQHQEQVR